MDAMYHIVINIRIPEGEMAIGDFLIADNAKAAFATFNELEGDKEILNWPVLRLDLVRFSRNMDKEVLDSISCTLAQLQANCKVIVRDAFKLFSIKRKAEL